MISARFLVFFRPDGYGEIPAEDLQTMFGLLVPSATIVCDYGRALLVACDPHVIASALSMHANLAYAPEHPDSFEE